MNEPILILYLLIAFAGLLIILLYPLVGLSLIFVMNPFDQLSNSLIDMPAGLTLGRLLGVLVFVGWFLRFALLRKSNVASLKGFNLIPLLMIFSMLVSTLLSSYPGESFGASLKITILITMLLFIQDFVTNEKQLKIIIIVIACTAGLASLIGVAQFLGYKGYIGLIGNFGNYGRAEGLRFSGFDDNPNGYGMTLMAGIPLLLFVLTEAKTHTLRFIFGIFMLTSIASLFLTMSRTHFFGLLFFIALFVFGKFKHNQITLKQIFFVAGVVLLSCFIFLEMPAFVSDRLVYDTFSGSDTSMEGRHDIFYKGIAILERNPLFGAGFYSSAEIDIAGFSDIKGYHGHDMVSLYVAGTGLVGAALFVMLCFLTYKYMNAALKYYAGVSDHYLTNLAITVKAGFLSLLATSLANPIIMQRIFWVYVALAAVLYRWTVMGQHAVRKKEVLPEGWRRRAYLPR